MIYILCNTNKDSKYYGKICISKFDPLNGSQYVFYRDGKNIYTRTTKFRVLRMVPNGYEFYHLGKKYRFSRLHLKQAVGIDGDGVIKLFNPFEIFGTGVRLG